jgi:hypothetical protein
MTAPSVALAVAATVLFATSSVALLVPPPSPLRRLHHALRAAPKLTDDVAPRTTNSPPPTSPSPSPSARTVTALQPLSLPLMLAAISAAVAPLPVHASAQEALQLLEGYQTRTPDNVVWYTLIGLIFFGNWYFNKVLASF